MNKFTIHLQEENIELEDYESSESSVRLLKEEIEKDAYGLMNMEFQKDDVVLDIGAHIGSVSIILAKLHPNIKIYAFEPSTEIYNLLIKNLEVNNIKNVVPIKAAVMDYCGTTNFCFNPNDTAGSSACYTPAMERLFTEHSWTTEKVTCITMAEIFKKYEILGNVAWLKLDAEGAEYKIFDDPNNMFHRIKKISMEIHFPISQFSKGINTLKDEFYHKLGRIWPRPKLDIVNTNWMVDSN